MLLLGVVATVAVAITFGWLMGAGVLAGSALAYVNFHWLEQVVSVLAERATRSSGARSGGGIVARFLLRYFLIALVAYAIFRVSPLALYGFLGGLFLAVAAILCEAVYEAYVALRRGL